MDTDSETPTFGWAWLHRLLGHACVQNRAVLAGSRPHVYAPRILICMRINPHSFLRMSNRHRIKPNEKFAIPHFQAAATPCFDKSIALVPYCHTVPSSSDNRRETSIATDVDPAVLDH